MKTVTEKRYQQQPVNNEKNIIQSLLITSLLYYLLSDFIIKFFSTMASSTLSNLMILTLIVCFFLIQFFIYKSLAKSQQLVINANGYQLPIKTFQWNDSVKVYEIIDFANSTLESQFDLHKKGFWKKRDCRALIIVNEEVETTSIIEKFILKRHALLITTNQWQINDFGELCNFLDDIGQKVQTITVNEAKDYFPSTTDLGKKAQTLAFSSIGFMIVGSILIQFDEYRTIDYGIVGYLTFSLIFFIMVISFHWIKGHWQLWIPHFIVSILYAGTLTFLLGSITFLISQNISENAQTQTFRYVGKVDGIKHWVLVDDESKGIDCREVAVEVGTAKVANVIYPIGMSRVKESDLCEVD